MVAILLQNGADASVFPVRRITLSKRATEILRLLARYGYDFTLKGHRILSEYDNQLRLPSRLTGVRDFSRDRETLDWLLDQGVDINKTDSQRLDDGSNLPGGESDYSLHLLNRVAADGNIDLFDHLVGRGADASLSTALHSASEGDGHRKSKAMIRYLLDKHHMNIDSNNGDFRDFFHDADDKGSPLCSAIINRNLVAVLELLERGASPSYPHVPCHLRSLSEWLCSRP